MPVPDQQQLSGSVNARCTGFLSALPRALSGHKWMISIIGSKVVSLFFPSSLWLFSQSSLLKDAPFNHDPASIAQLSRIYLSFVIVCPSSMPPISQASTLLNENRTVSVERTIFNTLLFLGGFLNATILVVAFWSRHVHRRTGWYNVLVSWVIYSISYLLIFGYQNGPEPSFGVCIAQAALIYSCPVLWVHICFTPCLLVCMFLSF